MKAHGHRAIEPEIRWGADYSDRSPAEWSTDREHVRVFRARSIVQYSYLKNDGALGSSSVVFQEASHRLQLLDPK